MHEEEVLQIVSRHLKRVRPSANGEISAICPFHRKPGGVEEKNPSFTMNLSKGVFYCHTCHSAGNFRQFLRDVGVGHQVLYHQYGQLIEALQKKQSLDFNPRQVKDVIDRDPLPESVLGLFDACPVAMVEYEARLQDDDPVFDEALLQKHDVGFDSKHGRITFPLRDLVGNLIGISGRACDPDVVPRYKVYDKEYEEYGLPKRDQTKKSAILWNAHNVYPRVYKERTQQDVVIVEGFKACLWLLQAGVPNVVALAGSSLSQSQVWVLERMGARYTLMLDNDYAGTEGLKKMAPRLSRSLDVYIAQYEGKQPTTLTQEQVLEAVEKRQDYYVWKTKHQLENM